MVPAPVVTHAALAPVFEYVTPAPVIEYIVRAPAMTCAVSCQQLPPAYTTTAVNADVNFDITGLVHPQISFTAVEAFSPQFVGSLPPLDEFVAPVYNHTNQEQIVAGKTTPNIVEIPAVQEQVIVREVPQAPQVVDSYSPFEEFDAPMCNQVLQEQIVATVQPHVLLQEVPEVLIVQRIQEQIVEPIDVLAPAVTYAAPRHLLSLKPSLLASTSTLPVL